MLLAGYFLEENRSRLGLSGLRLSADAQAALLAYRWPGNVRELEHLIGRSALKALAGHRERPRILTLSAADFGIGDTASVAPPAPLASDAPAAVGLREAVTAYERTLVLDALARNQQNWASTARELGIDRANLNRLARRLGLK